MASGDSLLVFDPLSNRPPASGFATVDLRGDFVVLDFDDTTSEQAQFLAVIPSHYGGGDLEAVFTWTSSSATSGNAKLDFELTRLAAGDNLDSPPAVAGSDAVTVAAPSTSGDLVVDRTGPLSVSGLVVGDSLWISISRLAADAVDTMAGDLELVSIELKEV